MRRLPFEQRRAELINAAARVIAREGLSAATVRAIVAEARMPLGSLHYIFESRDHLLRALISEVLDTERSALLQSMEMQTPASIEILIHRALDTYLALLEASPEQELAVLELSLHGARHNPELVAEQRATYNANAVEALEHGARLCRVSWTQPVDEIAKSLISVLDGITLTWTTTRDSAGARRHNEFVAKAFAALAIPLAGPDDSEVEASGG